MICPLSHHLQPSFFHARVEKFIDVAYHSKKGYKVSPDELAKVLQQVELERCQICFGKVKTVEDT
jgi:hypothetical protein